MDIKQIKKMRKQKGFSLIELLIVIAIVAILTAIAIPMYTSYTTRAKTAEAYSFIGSDKTYVAEQINAKGITTQAGLNSATLLTAGGSKTGKYGSVESNAAGVITYTFGAAAGSLSGNTLFFTPSVGSAGVTWACSSTGSYDSAPCDGI